MATKTITICDRDECGTSEGVQTYVVQLGTTKARIDLCGEHGAPLDEILATAPAATTAAPAKPDADADAEKAAKRKAARERRAAAKAAAGAAESETATA